MSVLFSYFSLVFGPYFQTIFRYFQVCSDEYQDVTKKVADSAEKTDRKYDVIKAGKESFRLDLSRIYTPIVLDKERGMKASLVPQVFVSVSSPQTLVSLFKLSHLQLKKLIIQNLVK